MGTARARMGAARRRPAGAPPLDLAPALATAGLVRRLVLADGTRPGGQQRVRRSRRLRPADARGWAGLLAPGALLPPHLLARPARVQVLSPRPRQRPGSGAAVIARLPVRAQRPRPPAQSATL